MEDKVKNEEFWKRVLAGQPDAELLAEAQQRLETASTDEQWILRGVVNTQRVMKLFQNPAEFADTLIGVSEYASEWLDVNSVEDVTAMREHRINSAVERVMRRHDAEFTVRSYSGRGMAGRMSDYALVTSAAPSTECGRALIALGLSYDSLGMDYVYYLG